MIQMVFFLQSLNCDFNVKTLKEIFLYLWFNFEWDKIKSQEDLKNVIQVF